MGLAGDVLVQGPAAMTATADPARLAALLHELFEAHAAWVHRTLLRLGVPSRDAEDVMHDVFVSAYRHLDELDPARPARPWLGRIAFHAAADYRRRVKVRAETAEASSELESIPGTADPEADVAARKRQATVLVALQAITNFDLREVFIMHDLDGMTMTEIANALSIRSSTGYSRLRLAREQFRAALERLTYRSKP